MPEAQVENCGRKSFSEQVSRMTPYDAVRRIWNGNSTDCAARPCLEPASSRGRSLPCCQWNMGATSRRTGEFSRRTGWFGVPFSL